MLQSRALRRRCCSFAALAVFTIFVVLNASCSGQSTTKATRAVCDNRVCVHLPSTWTSNVAFGGEESSQIIFAPFRFPSSVGHEKQIVAIPKHRFIVTIFNFGKASVNWPAARSLTVAGRPMLDSKPSAGRSKLVRRVRFQSFSIGILVEFADRSPGQAQIQLANQVLGSATAAS